MSLLFKRGPHAIHANLTPLIDVTFLLIVFFMLVLQITDLDNVEMALPTPQDPVSELFGDQHRVVIQVVPADPADRSTAKGYQLGELFFATDTEGRKNLANALAERYRRNPALEVNLRADRSTHYQWVDLVFRAVNEAATLSGRRDDVNGRINLVVSKEP